MTFNVELILPHSSPFFVSSRFLCLFFLLLVSFSPYIIPPCLLPSSFLYSLFLSSSFLHPCISNPCLSFLPFLLLPLFTLYSSFIFYPCISNPCLFLLFFPSLLLPLFAIFSSRPLQVPSLPSPRHTPPVSCPAPQQVAVTPVAAWRVLLSLLIAPSLRPAHSPSPRSHLRPAPSCIHDLSRVQSRHLYRY